MLTPSPRLAPPKDPLKWALKRHPFLLGSVVLHACLLGLLSQWHTQGLLDARLRADSAQIQAHTQAAKHHAMRRRVDSLKAMKELIERIDRAADASTDPSPADEPAGPAPAPSQPGSTVQTPQELLAQARELRDSIERIEQAAKARQMAEVLGISPQEALEKVKQQALAKAMSEGTPDASKPQSNEQVAQALERYEQQAREMLQRRLAQSEQQRNGTPTLPAPPGSTDSAAAAGAAAHAGAGSPGNSGPDSHSPGGAAANGAGGKPGAMAQASGGPSGGEGSAAGPGAGLPDKRPSSVVDTNPRQYGARLQPMAVDLSRLRLGAGNVIGEGGAFANRVFVDRWYVIGPFFAPDPSSMQTSYPPEELVDLDGVYLGKGKRVVRWQYLSSTPYPLIPPDQAERAMYYGYTEITSDQARDVWMAFGADDDAKAWVNDRLVWVSGNESKPWYTQGGVQSLVQDIRANNLIETRRLVHLKKGRNSVLFKLYNNPLDVFFSLLLEPVASPER